MTQNANTFLSLRLGITDTCLQQIIRVSVSLHGAGNPKAVDIKPASCFNGHPCVFRLNIFDKALSTLLTAIKDKSLIKALLQPLLFCKSLLAGHGAADMLPVDVFFCYMDIFHRSSPDFLHVYCIILVLPQSRPVPFPAFHRLPRAPSPSCSSAPRSYLRFPVCWHSAYIRRLS